MSSEHRVNRSFVGMNMGSGDCCDIILTAKDLKLVCEQVIGVLLIRRK